MARASSTAPASSSNGTSTAGGRVIARSTRSSSPASSTSVPGARTFGTNNPKAPARHAASASGRISALCELMRTNTLAPRWPALGTAAARRARAAAFSAGTTASSRSRMMASAPRSWALARNRSELAGT